MKHETALQNNLPELMAKAARERQAKLDNILIALSASFTIGAIIVLAYGILSIQ